MSPIQHQPYADGTYDEAAFRLLRVAAGDETSRLAAMLAGLDPWRQLGYPAEALASYLQRPDPCLARFRVATPVQPEGGVLCVRYPWLRGPYIELIGLAPDCRGSGLGAALIEWIGREAGPTARSIWAVVSEFNQAARRFYARCGFVEVTPLADLAVDGSTEILIRRRLA